MIAIVNVAAAFIIGVINVRDFFARLINSRKKEETAPEEPEGENTFECCSGKVHIAYRGVSDDRMYIAYNRNFKEIKFFKPNGLRVFCANCRRRIA